MNEKLKLINAELAEKTSVEFPYRKIVFGDGNANSKIMLVGEAPGGDEEKQGRPFVGKAGKNLMKFLAISNLKREEVYLTNVVKIRPVRLSQKTGKPVNRPPDRHEKDFFSDFLYKEIEIIQPKIIVTLGNVPLQAVLRNKNVQIGDYHGKLIRFGGNDIFPLYHPAAVIYNRSLKEVYNEDVEHLGRIIQ